MITTLAVQVTEDDIANARQGITNYCPIALALQRAIKNRHICASGVSFWKAAYISSYYNNIQLHSVVNAEATEWAIKFDRGEAVQPIEFLFFFE